MPSGSYTTRPPLKPPVLHILLALSEGALHGLGIADQVERTSKAVIKLGPGTLYRSLDEMLDKGLIERAEPPEEDADPRRKYYSITPRGERLLRAEMERLHRLVERAVDRGVLQGGT
jgi:DNA-binding PadR family transcriptional regulator